MGSDHKELEGGGSASETKASDHNRRRPFLRIIMSPQALVVLGVVVPLLVGGGIYLSTKQPSTIIPNQITRQLSFVPLVPEETDAVRVKDETVKYDTTSQQLSYNMLHESGSKELIVSQQPTPQSFSDVPELYQKLLDRMNQYESFDVPIGKVVLTKPSNLGVDNVQVAVINNAGTLSFLRSDSPLSTDEWRRLLLQFRQKD